jgi:Tsi6
MDFLMFKQILETAIDQTDSKIQQFPLYGPYLYAKDELLKIKNLSKDGSVPIFETNLGLMAAKELEIEDPEYADLLQKISFAVRLKK